MASSRSTPAFSADDFAPSGSFASAGDSSFDVGALEGSVRSPLASRWVGARLRLLVVGALLGCVGLFLLIRMLAMDATLNAQWRANVQGQLELVSSPDPRLRGLEGRTVVGVEVDGRVEPLH